jgi:hypothetical protein
VRSSNGVGEINRMADNLNQNMKKALAIMALATFILGVAVLLNTCSSKEGLKATFEASGDVGLYMKNKNNSNKN